MHQQKIIVSKPSVELLFGKVGIATVNMKTLNKFSRITHRRTCKLRAKRVSSPGACEVNNMETWKSRQLTMYSYETVVGVFPKSVSG